MTKFEQIAWLEYESWCIATDVWPYITTYRKGIRVSPQEGMDFEDIDFDYVDAIYMQFVDTDLVVTSIICKGDSDKEVSTMLHYEEI